MFYAQRHEEMCHYMIDLFSHVTFFSFIIFLDLLKAPFETLGVWERNICLNLIL